MRVLMASLIAAISAVTFLPGCVRTVGYGYDYDDQPSRFYDRGYYPYNNARPYYRPYEPYSYQRRSHPVVRHDGRRDGFQGGMHARD